MTGQDLTFLQNIVTGEETWCQVRSVDKVLCGYGTLSAETETNTSYEVLICWTVKIDKFGTVPDINPCASVFREKASWVYQSSPRHNDHICSPPLCHISFPKYKLKMKGQPYESIENIVAAVILKLNIVVCYILL
ncbi:hypothetical protein CDAR_47631 [Caerostris darwini]|uniref:Uncharacterized protein n=1 Tax=Caerostris darwini TaxID=1538125 RepID=A0AAV4M982_9ARAC|nr:hypothetical protein CDAR_47631 [Caerostris darwini]